MELNKILTAGLDDVIFIGRNKSYGAYFLRQIYGKNVRNGFLIALATFVVALGGPVLWKKFQKETIAETKVALVDMANIKPPPPVDPKTPPPPPPPPPPPIKTTVRFVPPVIKKDADVPPEDPPKQEELKTVDVSDKNVKGDPDAGQSALTIDAGNGNAVVEEKQIFKFVEQMPAYPGGEEAMLKFLSDNVKYPQIARDQEVEGRVILTFVVDETGHINDIQVLKDIGGGCGQAAVDAVRKMPPWTIGRQNGKAVRVQYNLPVMFTMSGN